MDSATDPPETSESHAAGSAEKAEIRAWGLRKSRWWERHPGVAIVLTILGLSGLFLAVTIPLDLQQLMSATRRGFHDHGMTGWIIKERMVEVLLFWWVVTFCASVGSFLNVVVYRMPLGMSLSAKGSHCVWCKHKIRSRDNLPIIGWLLLRGRCHKCRLPISGRYPLVEALTAILGLAMFLLTVQLRGWGLAPFQGQPIPWHFWLTGNAPVGPLIWYFYLLWMLAVCVAAAWINYDRNRLPVRLVVTSALAALLLPVLMVSVVQPYFLWSMRLPIEVSYTSELDQRYLEQLGWTAGRLPITWTPAKLEVAQLLIFRFAGGLVGCVAGLVVWGLSLISFPPVKQMASDEEIPLEQRKSEGTLLWESIALFGLSGLFAGPIFALLFASVHFLLVVVWTPLVMNTRLSPLQVPWFFLPYGFLISVASWRFVESLLLG